MRSLRSLLFCPLAAELRVGRTLEGAPFAPSNWGRRTSMSNAYSRPTRTLICLAPVHPSEYRWVQLPWGQRSYRFRGLREVADAMGKPSLFIGSSTEGLEFARALRSLLVHDAEVTIWNEGFFGLGSTFIETLVNSLPRFDFAVLILTGDDLLSSRDAESLGPRDNVLFELGLFMGRLGRSRTFILHQSNARLKIPSDLSGMTTATYEWPREDRSYRSAVGPACDSIRDVVRDLGVSDAKTARDISDIKSRQEELQQRQAEQQRDRSADKRTISGSVTRRT